MNPAFAILARREPMTRAALEERAMDRAAQPEARSPFARLAPRLRTEPPAKPRPKVYVSKREMLERHAARMRAYPEAVRRRAISEGVQQSWEVRKPMGTAT